MIFLGLTTFLLSGCGGSSSSSATNNVPLEVSEVSPNQSAVDVEREGVIKATFNKSLLASSVNNEQFLLSQGEASVSGSVQLKTDKQLELTPVSKLQSYTQYNVTLSRELSDIEGDVLSEVYHWSFITEDGQWAEEEALGNINSGGPRIAMDEEGNAIAAWYQNNGNSTYSAWASYYDISTKTWADAQQIGGGNMSTIAKFPRIVMDKEGNGIVVMGLVQGAHAGIWSSRFNKVDKTWSELTEIGSTALNDALSPEVVVDGLGNVLVVWRQRNDSSRYSAWVNRYDSVNNSWGNESVIDDNSNFDVQFPVISSDGKGNAIVVWAKRDSGNIANIWAARYAYADKQWQTAVKIENSDNTAVTPQVALDKNGNALAVWQQTDSDIEEQNGENIWAARFIAKSNSWQTPILIESDSGDAAAPAIAMDKQGNGISLWYQDNGSREITKASRYDVVNNVWKQSGPIGDSKDSMYEQKIAFQSNGNAIATWRQAVGSKFSVFSARYHVSNNTWQAAQVIENSVGGVDQVNLAINGSGDAIVVWRQAVTDQSGKSNQVYVNQFR
jgi:hypothetical protein